MLSVLIRVMFSPLWAEAHVKELSNIIFSNTVISINVLLEIIPANTFAHVPGLSVLSREYLGMSSKHANPPLHFFHGFILRAVHNLDILHISCMTSPEWGQL